MRFPLIAIIVATSCALTLVGCVSDQDNARKTADQFLSALERGDRAAVEKYLTPIARQKGALGMSDFVPTRSNNTESRHSVGTPSITGNEAAIPVTLTDNKNQDTKLYLRKEGNIWGVYALGLPIGPGGPEIKVDFENPEKSITESFHSIGKGVGQAVKGMEQGMLEFQKGFEEGYGKTASHSVDQEAKPETK